MHSTNPALNEQTFARERVVTIAAGRPGAGTRATMSLDGVVQKIALLLGLLVAGGAVGWSLVDTGGGAAIPAWLGAAALVAFGLAVLTVFVPRLARFTAPAYAVLEGLVAGAVSALYESAFDGIVLQAVVLTLGVAVALLVAFATGRLRVTDRFRLVVVSATFAIVAVYLFDLVARLFGAQVPYIHGAGPVGILFGLAVCVVAALNLVLDFDFIQKGIAGGTARHMEWYAGFAVCVHLVWLYLELLRLLARLRSR